MPAKELVWEWTHYQILRAIANDTHSSIFFWSCHILKTFQSGHLIMNRNCSDDHVTLCTVWSCDLVHADYLFYTIFEIDSIYKSQFFFSLAWLYLANDKYFPSEYPHFYVSTWVTCVDCCTTWWQNVIQTYRESSMMIVLILEYTDKQKHNGDQQYINKTWYYQQCMVNFNHL